MYQRTTLSPVPVNECIQIIFCGFFKTSTVECLQNSLLNQMLRYVQNTIWIKKNSNLNENMNMNTFGKKFRNL